MFSKADLEAMAESYLFAPLKEAVAQGMRLGDAMMRQAEMERQLGLAEQDVAAGRTMVMDDAYFERLHEHVRKVAAQRQGMVTVRISEEADRALLDVRLHISQDN